MSVIYANSMVSVKVGGVYIERHEIDADTIGIAMVYARQMLDDARTTNPDAEVEVEFEDEVIFDSSKWDEPTNSYDGAFIGIVSGWVMGRHLSFVSGALSVNEKLGMTVHNLHRLIMAEFVTNHVGLYEFNPSQKRICRFIWWKIDRLNGKK